MKRTAAAALRSTYWRILNGDEAGRTRVVEIIEWSGGRITACRVFHF